MSTNEEAKAQAEDAATETTDAPEIVADSVFLVIKDANGNFGVSTDINSKLTVANIASISDIRNGCRDITNIIAAREMAKMVADSLKG